MWEWIGGSAGSAQGALIADGRRSALADFAHASAFGGRLEELRGRCVLLATSDQVSAALALIELDGVARRLVLCPPDLSAAHLPMVIAEAGAETCVHTAVPAAAPAATAPAAALPAVPVQSELLPTPLERRASHATEWILLTSGTSGPPKLVVHTLASLTSAFAQRHAASAGRRAADASAASEVGGAAGAAHQAAAAPVWSTFYDIRRYGGLQILLRALAGATLLIDSSRAALPERLARAGAAGVTHLTGTASHWRAVLMSGAASRVAPRYVRLSGEIADQGILDALRAAYPQARIAHAFASTEAGVAFEVQDGYAGFPAAWVGAGEAPGGVAQLRIADGSLRVRSAGTAARYLGSAAPALRDAEGFVDTGDRVELREGRYYFLGRSGGIINVGGLKVHPEEVEAVINAHPWVRLSRVRARRSPITGSLVAAEVVRAEHGPGPAPSDAELSAQLQERCRGALAAHKVPAVVQFVPSLPLSAAGKLVRSDA